MAPDRCNAATSTIDPTYTKWHKKFGFFTSSGAILSLNPTLVYPWLIPPFPDSSAGRY
jgi:hypothetical protein